MIFFPTRLHCFKLHRGRPLTVREKQHCQLFFDHEVLDSVRIIDGKVPFWLHRHMDGVVLGNRIYFRAGVYQPESLCGMELLAHELTHVEQFFQGMTIIKYLWESRRGYRKNRFEVEAYAKAAMARLHWAL